jgi:hypothetical protein
MMIRRFQTGVHGSVTWKWSQITLDFMVPKGENDIASPCRLVYKGAMKSSASSKGSTQSMLAVALAIPTNWAHSNRP